MQVDQFSIFFIISLLAALLTLVLAVVTQRSNPPNDTLSFSWLMLLVAIWCGSVAIGMQATSEQAAFYWIIMRMIGVIFSPVAWVFMVLQYTGQDKLIRFRNVLLALVVPLLSLALFITNDSHHLFFSQIEYLQAGLFLVDETWTLGPYFFLHLLYSYGLILAGDYLLIREAVHLAEKHRRQAAILILATVVPLVVNVSYSFHLIPQLKVNYDPLGLAASGLLLGWGIFFNQMFDLSPIARGILVDSMADAMIVINQQNKIVDINPAAARIFKIDQSVIGSPLESIFDRLEFETLVQADSDQHRQIKIFYPDGQERYFEIHTALISGTDQPRGKLVTARDITAQKLVEAQLQYLAITDALTGLSNHRHFYELLDQELERARRSRHPFSVIMFDIDLFKQVNDQHGHLIGDQALREIAVICKKVLRQYDILCRYGGEEFSVILPNTTLQRAGVIAERLRQVVEKYKFEIEAIEFHLTVSLGVSCYEPDKALTSKELIERADQSLYFSKHNGRNQTTTYDQIAK